jgi:hypothetical protein
LVEILKVNRYVNANKLKNVRHVSVRKKDEINYQVRLSGNEDRKEEDKKEQRLECTDTYQIFRPLMCMRNFYFTVISILSYAIVLSDFSF